MIELDRYAYANNLLSVHPMEKFVFAVTMMLICLASDSVLPLLLVIVLMSYLVVFVAEIPINYFFRLMSLPISFLFLSVLTIAISISHNTTDLLASIHIFQINIGVRSEDMVKALHLFLMSLGSVSCLYFLSLTTPMIEIMSVLRKLKVPGLFIEIMSLTYRFIFVLLETARTIRTSQSARLGYVSVRQSFKSLSYLFSSLFVRALDRSQTLSVAMMSRCYTGEINLLEQEYPVCKKHYVYMAMVELALVLINMFLGGKFS